MIMPKISHTNLTKYQSVSTHPAISSRNLRSTGTDLLNVPEIKSALSNIARRAYSYAALGLWNSLQANLRTLAMTSVLGRLPNT